MPTNSASYATYNTPIISPDVPPYVPNNVYWVSSVTGNSGGGYTRENPAATIAQAIALVSANNGASKNDTIYVLPGHAETLTGAAALALSVAGVSIIGMGNKSNRPTLTLASTATTITVSAANVYLSNLIIKVSVDAVVKCFDITGAGAMFDRVDFVETASVALLNFATLSSAATDAVFQNCSWVQSVQAAAALQQWITFNASHRLKVFNCFATLKGFATSNPANGVLVGVTAATNDVEIVNNRFIHLNSTGNIVISLFAASTGFVDRNTVATSKTSQVGSVALANAYGGNNWATNTVNTNGLLDPVADS